MAGSVETSLFVNPMPYTFCINNFSHHVYIWPMKKHHSSIADKKRTFKTNWESLIGLELFTPIKHVIGLPLKKYQLPTQIQIDKDGVMFTQVIFPQ